MADILDYQKGTTYLIIYKTQFKRKNSFPALLKKLNIKENIENIQLLFLNVNFGDAFINSIDKDINTKYVHLKRSLFKFEDYFEDMLKWLRLPQNANDLYIPKDGGYMTR